MNEQLLLVLGYVAALFMAFNMGANDAANPTAAAVGAGAVTLRRALLLFGTGVFVGAVVQGRMVIKTLGKGVVPEVDVLGALISVIAAGIWILTATRLGMPISTSQSITGAVLGIGFAYVFMGRLGLGDLRWNVIVSIVLSWITSPLTAVFLALVFYLGFAKLFEKLARSSLERAEALFRRILVASLLFAAYAYGANDVGNATGVFVAVTSRYLGIPSSTSLLILSAMGAIGIAIGGIVAGYRVVQTIAYRITRLDYPMSASASLASALDVWLFTTIPYVLIGYGMPISTTHASVSAVIGVGIAKHRSLRGVNLKIVALILLSWLLTLPVASLISCGLYLAVVKLVS